MSRNIPSYSWEFHYPETPKWDLPIPAYSPDFFKQKAESIQETEIQKCGILRDSLKNGILISSEQEFQAWTNILNKNAIINLSQNDFSQINQWFGFVMQMNNHQEWVNIFPIESIMWLNPKGPFGKWGNISDNWIFTTSLNRDTTYTITENTISSIQEDAIVCETPKIEVPHIIHSPLDPNYIDPVNNQEEEKKNPENKEYTIKKWDWLWKIIREQYWETHPTDVANIENILLTNNPQIKNKDKISPGEKIILLWEIKINSKARGEKTFSLKQ